MSEIRKWLEAIGLGQYGDAFEVNEIDMDLLGQVDDQILKDIGVSAAGHRLRIRNAIAELTPTPIGEPNLSSTAPTRETTAASAERRQVTVMFSDLVGSMALSARMDPEDLREVISAYQKCVTETVRHFEGFVAKYMGDGVLVYFGYPQAHEDDAERAVRAGLELIGAVAALGGLSLQTRIGIATGLVVVGDLVGSGEAQERGIILVEKNGQRQLWIPQAFLSRRHPHLDGNGALNRKRATPRRTLNFRFGGPPVEGYSNTTTGGCR